MEILIESTGATQILIMFAMLVGGLAFFMYGMNVMSSGLETMAGGGLERTMKKVTANDFLGFFLGAGITVAIQSSSAFTVMLVGLVNSGIVQFGNTFGMIMGSNVGTTLTAWILSLAGISKDSFVMTLLQPMTFSPILAFIGIVIRMFTKSEKKHNLGIIFIGFAVLMFGMELMSASMVSVREIPGFDKFLASLSSPIIALLVSTIFTGVIQSSAATIGIVQALALSGGITWQMAIPLVLGANIGTCVTALISSVGTNKNAKRVVIMHFFVNVFGSGICMIIMYIMKALGVALLGAEIGMVGVAIVHTLFNVVTTVVLFPIKKILIGFCAKLVPEDKEEKQHTAFLDERIFNNTPLAISECRRLSNEMADYTRQAIMSSLDIIAGYDESKAKFVKDIETLTDKYEDKLGTYLVRLSSNNLTEDDSHAVSRMLHSLSDFERISDHALNLCGTALEIKEKNIVFSNDAKRELGVTIQALREIVDITIDSYVHDDFEKAAQVEPIEQVIDKLKDDLKARHIDRLQKGECTVQMGFVFSDLLTNIERVSDHCSNIAVYTIQRDSPKLDTHKYLRNVKTDAVGNFVEEYNIYEKKYSLD
ncbi:MAG: Na/Pi cotransporter family protein [Ruminococcaceae bacterium]|nr:Na/Pi cotransporter family protein [Oscillospiraceae bacterium]